MSGEKELKPPKPRAVACPGLQLSIGAEPPAPPGAALGLGFPVLSGEGSASAGKSLLCTQAALEMCWGPASKRMVRTRGGPPGRVDRGAPYWVSAELFLHFGASCEFQFKKGFCCLKKSHV